MAEQPEAGLPLIPLPTNCPGCGIGLDLEELRAHCYVCTCGHHFRMGADAWIALLADPGSWQERWSDIRPHDLLDWKRPKPYEDTIEAGRDEGLNEAVRTGNATVDGRAVWLAVFDFRFVGGTLSIVAGERLARGLEASAASGVPYVLVTASGGARMQEGVLALMQLAKVNGAVGRLHASRTPYFSILTDPTFSERASPLGFVAPKRHLAPGLALAELPHIDAVVVSHNHYDHLDEASVKALAAQAGGPPLFVVSETSRLRVYVNVPQSYVPSIPVGTKARISVPEYPGRTFPATVEASAQAVDIASGTTRMQLGFDNSSGELMPGAYANVRMSLARDSVPLHIPDYGKQIQYRQGDKVVEAMRDIDATLSQQLDNLTTGQWVSQVPTDRGQDDVGWPAVATEG